MNLIVATESGVVVAERAGEEWRAARRGLRGGRVTSVIAREGVILAGTHDGVQRSDDLGATWRDASDGLTTRYVRWLANDPAVSDREFAGTEPAGIFVSSDGGASWRACPEVTALRDRYHWFLPYSPEAGCIRGFAFHGRRAYAAAEVGGALCSDDGGATWRLCEGSDGKPDLDGPPPPLIYPDVHSIETHPALPDAVFAPTGGGLYVSQDGGVTWQLVYDCYIRAMWLDPRDPAHWLVGPADGVSRNGRIEETHDGGASYAPASGGLAVPWPRHMVERFRQVDDEVIAVLSNGELYAARLEEWQWRRVLPELSDSSAVAAMG